MSDRLVGRSGVAPQVADKRWLQTVAFLLDYSSFPASLVAFPEKIGFTRALHLPSLYLGHAFQVIYKLLFAFISVEKRRDKVAGTWQSEDMSDSLAIGTAFRTMRFTAAGV